MKKECVFHFSSPSSILFCEESCSVSWRRNPVTHYVFLIEISTGARYGIKRTRKQAEKQVLNLKHCTVEPEIVYSEIDLNGIGMQQVQKWSSSSELSKLQISPNLSFEKVGGSRIFLFPSL